MRRALFGGAVWILAAVLCAASPFDVSWARLLLVLAALVLVPLGLRLAPVAPSLAAPIDRLQLPAALLLGLAQLLEPGLVAAGLALPWLAMTGLVALGGLARLRSRRRVFSTETCLDAALLYLVVGGAWAVSDRLGFRPLDFDPVIVLLTAIHFHYAGFVLPLVCGLASRRFAGKDVAAIGIAVVAGIPAVALGITATQLGLPPALECVAAWFLAAAGAGVALLHGLLALDRDWPAAVRGLWALSALSLAGSVILAALYGARFFTPWYVPLQWLDIPWMRALHGTANGIGFALASLLAWSGVKSPYRDAFASIRTRLEPDIT